MNARFTIALAHIAAIRSYIEARSPIAAAHIVARILADADRLADFPHIGHAGVVPDTYEWIVQGLPYIILHEIDDQNEEIIVLGIFHGAQQR